MRDGEMETLLDAVADFIKIRGASKEDFEALRSRLDAIPLPTKGDPGEPGVAGENGKDGAAGRDGVDGANGIDGKSVSLEDVRPIIDDFLKSLPVPTNGRDGKDGLDGKSGADGKSLTVDDIRPLFDTAMSSWALEFERRGMDLVQRTLERIEKPKDGKNGRDALDLATLDVKVEDDFRTWRVSAKAGAELVERTLYVPVPMFQGVWRQGSYERGDIVAFGGSSFIARRDTTSKPETDDSWTLFTKRGRDGKDAKVERADAAPVRFK